MPLQGGGEPVRPSEQASSIRTRRVVGTQTSEQHRRAYHSQQRATRLQQGAASAALVVDNLPGGGWRVDVRQRLTDLAWSPSKAGLLGFTGNSSTQLTIMDVAEVR